MIDKVPVWTIQLWTCDESIALSVVDCFSDPTEDINNLAVGAREALWVGPKDIEDGPQVLLTREALRSGRVVLRMSKNYREK